ncbi:uncharacterized protein ColSpa_00227 [Colletotrichum spaethianum]|uniref:Uncharacterized protein n=1 Tax=Colletotrichum spaethianum TaxID=700344 RepID=A0AA37L149_9PEZI|nr:uncharacterized protein ColSpa_00227 [Colletotrichum spaethianum]GKT40046.1 hypothetical protein ColSpa_00227 [Colletotrichum spaethianum]
MSREAHGQLVVQGGRVGQRISPYRIGNATLRAEPDTALFFGTSLVSGGRPFGPDDTDRSGPE